MYLSDSLTQSRFYPIALLLNIPIDSPAPKVINNLMNKITERDPSLLNNGLNVLDCQLKQDPDAPSEEGEGKRKGNSGAVVAVAVVVVVILVGK